MKLYYATGTCALASHIALEESGADYTPVRVDFRAEEQRKRTIWLSIRKGALPALVTERGVLTETPAILAYVAQSFPKTCRRSTAPSICPGASLQQLSLLHGSCRSCHRMRGTRWADDPAAIAEMKRKVPANCRRVLCPDRAPDVHWTVGDGRQYTICDPISLPWRNGWRPTVSISQGFRR